MNQFLPNRTRIVRAAAVALALTLFAALPSLARPGDDKNKPEAREYAPLAVLPFARPDRGRAFNSLTDSDSLTEKIVQALVDENMIVVERNQLTTLDQEHALASTGSVSEQDAAQLGRKRGARYILAGRIEDAHVSSEVFQTIWKVTLTARLIDVERGIVVPGAAFQVKGEKKRGLTLTKPDELDIGPYLDAANTAARNLAVLVKKKYPELTPEDKIRYGTGIVLYPVDNVTGEGADRGAAEANACRKAVEQVTRALCDPDKLAAAGDYLEKEVYSLASHLAVIEDKPALEDTSKGYSAHFKVKVFLTSPGGSEKKDLLPFLNQQQLMRPLKLIIVVPGKQDAGGSQSAEATLVSFFNKLGFQNLDQAQTEKLRSNEADLKMIEQANSAAEIEAFRAKYPADIFVVGEGHCEEVGRDRNLRRARTQMNVKAIQVGKTEARILGYEGASVSGAGGDFNSASQQSYTQAGLLLGPKLAQTIFTTYYPLNGKAPGGIANNGGGNNPGGNNGGTVKPVPTPGDTLTLVVKGWAGLGETRKFLKALADMPGIESAEKTSFDEGVLTATVKAKPETLKKLSEWLEEDPKLMPFHIKVKTEKDGRIEGECGAASDPPKLPDPVKPETKPETKKDPPKPDPKKPTKKPGK